MVLLVKNILTASKRSFQFKKGEQIEGTPFHFVKEEKPRDFSSRWSVFSPPDNRHFICEIIDPNDDPLILALSTNSLAAIGATRHEGLANILAAGWLVDGVYFQVLDLSPEERPWLPEQHAKRMGEKLFLENADRLLEGMIHLHKNNLLHTAISPLCLRAVGETLSLSELWWSRSCLGNAYEAEIERFYPDALSPMTLFCLAPEVLGGNRPTRESDLFSLGCTFFYLLSGEFPRIFEAKNQPELSLKDIMEARLKDLKALRPDLNPQIYRAINFCLQKEGASRQDVFAVRELLQDASGKKPRFFIEEEEEEEAR